MMGPPTKADIQDAISRGNLDEMTALAQEVEDQMDRQGDLAEALQQLKAAIAAAGK